MLNPPSPPPRDVGELSPLNDPRALRVHRFNLHRHHGRARRLRIDDSGHQEMLFPVLWIDGRPLGMQQLSRVQPGGLGWHDDHLSRLMKCSLRESHTRRQSRHSSPRTTIRGAISDRASELRAASIRAPDPEHPCRPGGPQPVRLHRAARAGRPATDQEIGRTDRIPGSAHCCDRLPAPDRAHRSQYRAAGRTLRDGFPWCPRSSAACRLAEKCRTRELP